MPPVPRPSPGPWSTLTAQRGSRPDTVSLCLGRKPPSPVLSYSPPPHKSHLTLWPIPEPYGRLTAHRLPAAPALPTQSLALICWTPAGAHDAGA